MSLVLKALLEPIKSKPLFQIGRTVRVLKRIDVNMPGELNYWLDTKCEVIQQVPRGLISKEWAYLLRHSNGHICEFLEHEIDKRYASKG